MKMIKSIDAMIDFDGRCILNWRYDGDRG